jgi:peptidoglycan-associated lipoprotein
MRVGVISKLVVVLSIVLGLVGCASCKSSRHAKGNDLGSGVGDMAQFYGENITPAEERELLSKNIIYFGYDRFDITPEYNRIILAHARKMLQNDKLRIRIDGHTDERGSREYNIGLGERRAKAVAKVMSLKGVSEERIVTVSYGKEKPVAVGHGEETWKQNRRAELAYEGNN